MNAIEELKKLKQAGAEELLASAIVELVARHNDELVTKDYLDVALERRIAPVEKAVVSLKATIKTAAWCLGLGIPSAMGICTAILGWILTHFTLKP